MCGLPDDGWRTMMPPPLPPHAIAAVVADDAGDAAVVSDSDATDAPIMLVPVDVVVGAVVDVCASTAIVGSIVVAAAVVVIVVAAAVVVVVVVAAEVHISTRLLSISSSIAGRGESEHGDCSRDVESRSSSLSVPVPNNGRDGVSEPSHQSLALSLSLSTTYPYSHRGRRPHRRPGHPLSLA